MESQPNGYLNRLPQDKPAALLFVAPDTRMESLWAVLRLRVELSGDRLVSDDHPKSMRSGVVALTQKHLMLVSWPHLLERMAAGAIAAGESGVDADIRQVKGLAHRMDVAEVFLPLRQEEFAPEFPRRVRGLMRLVHDSIGRMTDQGLQAVQRLRGLPWYGYGRSFNLSGTSVWFGIRWTLWSGNGITPVWLQFHDLDEVMVSEIRAKLQLPAYPDNWLPVFLKTGVEYDAVLADVVSQLKTIGDAVNAAGSEA